MPTTEMRFHCCQTSVYDCSVSSDPILSVLPRPILPPPVPPPRPRRLPAHTPIVPVSHRFPQSPPLPPLPPRCGVVGCCMEQKIQILLKYKSVWGRFFLFTHSTVICCRNCPPCAETQIFCKKKRQFVKCMINDGVWCGVVWRWWWRRAWPCVYLHAPGTFLLKPRPQV